MKNNKGITLIALILTIVVMGIILGISVIDGGDTLQKSKMTEYIGLMKLVKARADVVLEDEMFENGSITGETIVSLEDLQKIDGTEAITDFDIKVNYYDYGGKIFIKWNGYKIANQGIDSRILGNNEYFVVIFDQDKKETVDVLYSTGCRINSQTYYLLNDCENAINGQTPFTPLIPVENLITDGGIEQGNWGGINQYTPGWSIDTSIVHSGKNSLKLEGGGSTTSGAETYVRFGEDVEFKINHQYYISFYNYTNVNDSNMIQIYWKLDGNSPNQSLNYTPNSINNWVKYSSCFKSNYNTTSCVRFDFNNSNPANIMIYDDILLVDLTEILDFNSEPVKNWTDDELKAWCDANLEYGVTEVAVPTN